MNIVQNDDGTAVEANAYVDDAYFRIYHAARGRAFAQTVLQVNEACVIATDYLDSRFLYQGEPKQRTQTTQFPRRYLEDRYGNDVNTVPVLVKRACAEYAAIWLNQGFLVKAPVRDNTGTAILEKEEKVGPLLERTVYKASGFEMPNYPDADRILRNSGFVETTGQFQRG